MLNFGRLRRATTGTCTGRSSRSSSSPWPPARRAVALALILDAVQPAHQVAGRISLWQDAARAFPCRRPSRAIPGRGRSRSRRNRRNRGRTRTLAPAGIEPAHPSAPVNASGGTESDTAGRRRRQLARTRATVMVRTAWLVPFLPLVGALLAALLGGTPAQKLAALAGHRLHRRWPAAPC